MCLRAHRNRGEMKLAATTMVLERGLRGCEGGRAGGFAVRGRAAADAEVEVGARAQVRASRLRARDAPP